MSLAGFLRKFGQRQMATNRLMMRSLVSTRMMSTQTKLDLTTSTPRYENPREMNIEFLITLFQRLHSRNLVEVMNETLAEYSLTKAQTIAILESDRFLNMNEQIVIALLQNKALVRDNVEPHELWESLKNWSKNCVANRPARAPSPFRISGDKEREWLEVMKVFLPYIDFESMDAKFFIDNIESIPDSYAILSRDRKYRIMKQHVLNLLEKQNNNNYNNNTQEEINSAVLASFRQPNEIVADGFEESIPVQHEVNDVYSTEVNNNDNNNNNNNRYQRLDKDLYGQPLSY